MKKLFVGSFLRIAFILFSFNSIDVIGPWCNSMTQIAMPSGAINQTCLNNSSVFKLFVSREWYVDGYGNYIYTYRNINVKNPLGTTVLVITEGMLSESGGNLYYLFPIGFFNLVGTWSYQYDTYDACTATWYSNPNYLTIYGFSANIIASDEIICIGGGTPQNIINSDLSSIGTYNIKWQSNTNGAGWYDISGATGVTYQPSYINQITKYRRIGIITENTQCTATSNEVTKYVYHAFSPGVIGSDQYLCYNVLS